MMVPHTINADRSIKVNDIPPMTIGGTMMSALVGESEFMTPFMAQCSLLGIYKTPGNEAMRLGQTMESDVISQASKRMKKKIVTFPPIQGDYSNWPYHKMEGAFGAHVDGITSDNSDIVEVKTTSNIKKWMDTDGNPTIPKGYYIQASLYAYLFGIENIIFAVAVINKSAYAAPETVPKYKLVLLRVQSMHVVNEHLWRAMMWDAECIVQKLRRDGTTCAPDMQDERDRKAYKDITGCECTSNVSKFLDELYEVRKEKSRLEAREKELSSQAKVMLAFQTEDGGKLTASDSMGRVWTYRRDIRQNVDYKQACADNEIDLRDYTTEKITEVLDTPKEEKTKEE